MRIDRFQLAQEIITDNIWKSFIILALVGHDPAVSVMLLNLPKGATSDNAARSTNATPCDYNTSRKRVVAEARHLLDSRW
jgi:hypothetical protein